MADTPLPSIATVNDEQLAALLDCYGDVTGWKRAMIQHMLDDIRRKKQSEIQVIYRQRLDELNDQEATAMAAVDLMLANLINP